MSFCCHFFVIHACHFGFALSFFVILLSFCCHLFVILLSFWERENAKKLLKKWLPWQTFCYLVAAPNTKEQVQKLLESQPAMKRIGQGSLPWRIRFSACLDEELSPSSGCRLGGSRLKNRVKGPGPGWNGPGGAAQGREAGSTWKLQKRNFTSTRVITFCIFFAFPRLGVIFFWHFFAFPKPGVIFLHLFFAFPRPGLTPSPLDPDEKSTRKWQKMTNKWPACWWNCVFGLSSSAQDPATRAGWENDKQMTQKWQQNSKKNDKKMTPQNRNDKKMTKQWQNQTTKKIFNNLQSLLVRFS